MPKVKSDIDNENPYWKDERDWDDKDAEYNEISPIEVRKDFEKNADEISADIREEAVRCGLPEICVQMALTGREFFLDGSSKPVAGNPLPLSERMKLIALVMGKIMPNATPLPVKKEKPPEPEDQDKWIKLAQKNGGSQDE